MKTIAAMFLLVASATHAQEQSQLCHHAGLAYSTGSMIAMGKSLQMCSAIDGGTAWLPLKTDERPTESANCAYDGKEFGQGAVLDVVAATLKCSNGTWYPS